ncbi:ferric reductase-like transmembrane domain-containing protein [Actinacidiphila acidipaludis]|uniref:Ferric reductase-like transmembrane domain-containing protein n=1 Tax=Actinacidiphila acidipaludis TaxID=2873382 RepID=A0ABS7PZB2_9ACTN|nr:ferric reductase-like transmembrane domain-containing protein [Streptomyces acidipaludis]MBY8876234.1 ferric reductase-like transmembrane domain-containing protein [Streptomyces acidipaludis]
MTAHTAVLLAASGPSPLWYATRAAGTASLVLLTLTVVLGIAAAGRYAPRNIGRFEVSALHRNLSLMTLVFLALHIVTAIADSFTHIGWPAAVVPFASSYRPLWVGLGAVALDLLLAVGITSAFRRRIGHRMWKAVHWSAYAAWPVALFHAAGTGTDTRLTPQLLLYAACVAAVLGAVWWRLARAGAGSRRVRWWVLPATGIVPVLLVVFLATGPLRPGWSHRAAATFPSKPAVATAPALPAGPAASASSTPQGGESE